MFGLIDLDEIQILLLAHELCLNKFKKSYTPNMVSLNLAQVTYSHAISKDVHSISVDSTSSQMLTPPIEHDFN